ncbi:MAG: hypothetical protein ACQESA_01140 [Patescibacteria group bacterium]
MSNNKNNHLALGERNWWIGVILLIFLVILFSKEFLTGGIKEIIADPVYFFSVIMVGLVIASPIVWIFNQGRTLVSKKALEGLDREEKIFGSLLSLSDKFRVFQSITIEDEKFEVLVIGERTLTVISILRTDDLSSSRAIDSTIKRTHKKVLFLKSFFNREVPVNFLIVREGDGPETDQNLKKYHKKKIVDPSNMKKELEAQNDNNFYPLSNRITERIESYWKRGPRRSHFK